MEWPRGEATACKAVYTGSNPVSPSTNAHKWAVGAAVARFPDTEEVAGSIPVPPTSTKRPLTCGNAFQGPFILESAKRPMVPLIDNLRDK